MDFSSSTDGQGERTARVQTHNVHKIKQTDKVAADWDCQRCISAGRVKKRVLGCINMNHIILRLSIETHIYNLC